MSKILTRVCKATAPEINKIYSIAPDSKEEFNKLWIYGAKEVDSNGRLVANVGTIHIGEKTDSGPVTPDPIEADGPPIKIELPPGVTKSVREVVFQVATALDGVWCKHWPALVMFLFLLWPCASTGQESSFTRASQSQFNSGTDNSHGVTPKQLRDLQTGAGGAAAGGVAYVSPSGSDSAVTVGLKGSPFLTLSNALQRIGGNGIIYVRGGKYFNQSLNLSNATRVDIHAYSNEVPQFWFGHHLAAASFTAVSNGIYQANMGPGFLAALTFHTNAWNDNSPPEGWGNLYQTNVGYGARTLTSQNFIYPAMGHRSFETNRMEHTPLFHATNFTAMLNSNGFWFAQGGTLYVKFAVSNSPGGIYLSATNETDSVFHNANGTILSVSGIQTFFGYKGFDYSKCQKVELTGCRAFGVGFASFLAADPLGTACGSISLTHCVSSGANMFGHLVNNIASEGTNRWTSVTENGCLYHDGVRESSSMMGNVNRSAVNSHVAFNGARPSGLSRAGFGFIDSGSYSEYNGCTSFSNAVAGWQLGDIFGRHSFAKLSNCKVLADRIDLNDWGDVLLVDNTTFSPREANAIFALGDTTTHFVQVTGCILTDDFYSSGINMEFINGSADTTRYKVSKMGYGPSTLEVHGLMFLRGATAPNGSSVGTLQIDGGAPAPSIVTDNAWKQRSTTVKYPVTGDDFYLWNSNRMVYGVSATKTNLVTDLR